MSASRRNAISTLFVLTLVSLSPSLGSAQQATAPRVALKTTAGDIVLELNPAKSPKSVDNFLQYVKSGQYNGTIFHRVMNGFMIQGGGMDKDMKEKPTRASILNEAKNGLKNEAYTVAMARMQDPDSATAQFFINVADNGMLDFPQPDGAGYAVFGKVVQGKEVVDQIKTAATGDNASHRNVPLKPIVITSARVLP